jgi:hypothetical protein
MKDEKFGRKTSPGFGDPRAVVRGVPVQPITGANAQARPGSTRPPVRAPNSNSQPPPPVHSALPPRPTGAPGAGSNRPRAARNKPLVEVEVLRERTRTPRPNPFQGCYEIWTQNHVYALDSRMRCVEVRTPQTSEVRADHPFLGGRLVGGQAQEDAMEMSHPLPRPGAYAVFELRKKTRRQFVRTSPVERVVLRLRIVTIADGAEVPSWEDVAESDD